MLKNCQASSPVLIPSPHSQASLSGLIPSPHSQASLSGLIPSPHSMSSFPGLAHLSQYEFVQFAQGLGTRLSTSFLVCAICVQVHCWLVQTYFLLGMCGMRCVQYLSTVNESQRWELPTTWHPIPQVLICYHGNLSSYGLFYWIWKHKQGIEYERNSCKNVAFSFNGTGNTSVFSKHCFAMMSWCVIPLLSINISFCDDVMMCNTSVVNKHIVLRWCHDV